MSNFEIEQRGHCAVAWQKGRHSFYEDRYRLLCRPIPLVEQAGRGEIYAVCDGVGSAPKGMAAAQEVCNILVRFYENAKMLPASSEAILDLLNQANDEILSWGTIQDAVRSLGACAGTVIWVDKNWVAHVFHAGDTSALLIRDGIVQQLTTVHHSAAGHLTSYFGLDYLQLETKEIQLEEGDRLLLLSDGITKVLYNQQITDLVESQPTRPASLSALFKAANNKGTRDDATAVLFDTESD